MNPDISLSYSLKNYITLRELLKKEVPLEGRGRPNNTQLSEVKEKTRKRPRHRVSRPNRIPLKRAPVVITP